MLEAIKEFDTPTIFNAVSRVMRDLTPQKWYSNHTIRHLIPTLGSFCGEPPATSELLLVTLGSSVDGQGTR